MRLALRIVGLIAIALIALAGMALQFPFMKEGASWEEIPFLAAGGLGLVAVGVAWWWGGGKQLIWVLPAWVLLAPPALTALTVSWQFWQARIDGQMATAEAQILDYRERFIEWPGFDGPVGLAVEIRVGLPNWAEGLFYPPELRMGPALYIPPDKLAATVTSGSGYFKDGYIDPEVGELMLLKNVLFDQREPPGADHPRLEPGGVAEVAFELYPGVIDLIDGPEKVCLGDAAPGLPACDPSQDPRTGCIRKNYRRTPKPIYNNGGDLSALWFVAGRHGLRIDLSAPLTRTLRERSGLQDNPDSWSEIQRRMTPTSLAEAGYSLCEPGPHSHSGFRVCYCLG